MALSIKTSDQEFEHMLHNQENEDENDDHPVMKQLDNIDRFRVQENDELSQQIPTQEVTSNLSHVDKVELSAEPDKNIIDNSHQS